MWHVSVRSALVAANAQRTRLSSARRARCIWNRMSVASVPGDEMQSELGDGQKRCWSRRTWLEAASMRDNHNGACRRRVSIPNAPMGCKLEAPFVTEPSR